MGNGHANLAPYQSFPTADGDLIVAVGNDRQFRRMCAVLGAPALASDPRFVTNPARVTNRVALIPLVMEHTLRWSSAPLQAALEAEGVPVGAVNRIDQVFADPQVIARGLRIEALSDTGDVLPGLASPLVIDGVRQGSGRASPRLDEHQGARWWSRP